MDSEEVGVPRWKKNRALVHNRKDRNPLPGASRRTRPSKLRLQNFPCSCSRSRMEVLCIRIVICATTLTYTIPEGFSRRGTETCSSKQMRALCNKPQAYQRTNAPISTLSMKRTSTARYPPVKPSFERAAVM